jgi:large conductance mechanosensitive channel
LEDAEMGMLKEFKDFAMRGDVVDLAVGVVIGAAFGKIVTSLVSDIIMPMVGAIAGKGNFKDSYLWLGSGEKPATLADALKTNQPLIGWGAFLDTIIQFIIVAFAIFVVVKAINTARERFEKKQDVPAAAPPEDILLLREIRDALARR